MNQKECHEIIDFAIEREQEAVKFYQELQAMVHFQKRKELLKEFEDMEKGHVHALENIRNGITAMREMPKTQGLKASDYLVVPQPSAAMSCQDSIIIAMKREEAAMQLYTDLANLFGEPDIKQLFQQLAAEEQKHKLHFEKMYHDGEVKDL
ncbi:MAG: ferritin family protein [Pseudomonadota bacterium]